MGTNAVAAWRRPSHALRSFAAASVAPRALSFPPSSVFAGVDAAALAATLDTAAGAAAVASGAVVPAIVSSEATVTATLVTLYALTQLRALVLASAEAAEQEAVAAAAEAAATEAEDALMSLKNAVIESVSAITKSADSGAAVDVEAVHEWTVWDVAASPLVTDLGLASQAELAAHSHALQAADSARRLAMQQSGLLNAAAESAESETAAAVAWLARTGGAATALYTGSDANASVKAAAAANAASASRRNGRAAASVVVADAGSGVGQWLRLLLNAKNTNATSHSGTDKAANATASVNEVSGAGAGVSVDETVALDSLCARMLPAAVLTRRRALPVSHTLLMLHSLTAFASQPASVNAAAGAVASHARSLIPAVDANKSASRSVIAVAAAAAAAAATSGSTTATAAGPGMSLALSFARDRRATPLLLTLTAAAFSTTTSSANSSHSAWSAALSAASVGLASQSREKDLLSTDVGAVLMAAGGVTATLELVMMRLNLMALARVEREALAVAVLAEEEEEEEGGDDDGNNVGGSDSDLDGNDGEYVLVSRHNSNFHNNTLAAAKSPTRAATKGGLRDVSARIAGEDFPINAPWLRHTHITGVSSDSDCDADSGSHSGSESDSESESSDAAMTAAANTSCGSVSDTNALTVYTKSLPKYARSKPTSKSHVNELAVLLGLALPLNDPYHSQHPEDLDAYSNDPLSSDDCDLYFTLAASASASAGPPPPRAPPGEGPAAREALTAALRHAPPQDMAVTGLGYAYALLSAHVTTLPEPIVARAAAAVRPRARHEGDTRVGLGALSKRVQLLVSRDIAAIAASVSVATPVGTAACNASSNSGVTVRVFDDISLYSNAEEHLNTTGDGSAVVFSSASGIAPGAPVVGTLPDDFDPSKLGNASPATGDDGFALVPLPLPRRSGDGSDIAVNYAHNHSHRRRSSLTPVYSSRSPHFVANSGIDTATPLRAVATTINSISGSARPRAVSATAAAAANANSGSITAAETGGTPYNHKLLRRAPHPAAAAVAAALAAAGIALPPLESNRSPALSGSASAASPSHGHSQGAYNRAVRSPVMLGSVGTVPNFDLSQLGEGLGEIMRHSASRVSLAALSSQAGDSDSDRDTNASDCEQQLSPRLGTVSSVVSVVDSEVVAKNDDNNEDANGTINNICDVDAHMSNAKNIMIDIDSDKQRLSASKHTVKRRLSPRVAAALALALPPPHSAPALPPATRALALLACAPAAALAAAAAASSHYNIAGYISLLASLLPTLPRAGLQRLCELLDPGYPVAPAVAAALAHADGLPPSASAAVGGGPGANAAGRLALRRGVLVLSQSPLATNANNNAGSYSGRDAGKSAAAAIDVVNVSAIALSAEAKGRAHSLFLSTDCSVYDCNAPQAATPLIPSTHATQQDASASVTAPRGVVTPVMVARFRKSGSIWASHIPASVLASTTAAAASAAAARGQPPQQVPASLRKLVRAVVETYLNALVRLTAMDEASRTEKIMQRVKEADEYFSVLSARVNSALVNDDNNDDGNDEAGDGVSKPNVVYALSESMPSMWHDLSETRSSLLPLCVSSMLSLHGAYRPTALASACNDTGATTVVQWLLITPTLIAETAQHFTSVTTANSITATTTSSSANNRLVLKSTTHSAGMSTSSSTAASASLTTVSLPLQLSVPTAELFLHSSLTQTLQMMAAWTPLAVPFSGASARSSMSSGKGLLQLLCSQSGRSLVTHVSQLGSGAVTVFSTTADGSSVSDGFIGAVRALMLTAFWSRALPVLHETLLRLTATCNASKCVSPADCRVCISASGHTQNSSSCHNLSASTFSAFEAAAVNRCLTTVAAAAITVTSAASTWAATAAPIVAQTWSQLPNSINSHAGVKAATSVLTLLSQWPLQPLEAYLTECICPGLPVPVMTASCNGNKTSRWTAAVAPVGAVLAGVFLHAPLVVNTSTADASTDTTSMFACAPDNASVLTASLRDVSLVSHVCGHARNTLAVPLPPLVSVVQQVLLTPATLATATGPTVNASNASAAASGVDTAGPALASLLMSSPYTAGLPPAAAVAAVLAEAPLTHPAAPGSGAAPAAHPLALPLLLSPRVAVAAAAALALTPEAHALTLTQLADAQAALRPQSCDGSQATAENATVAATTTLSLLQRRRNNRNPQQQSRRRETAAGADTAVNALAALAVHADSVSAESAAVSSASNADAVLSASLAESSLAASSSSRGKTSTVMDPQLWQRVLSIVSHSASEATAVFEPFFAHTHSASSPMTGNKNSRHSNIGNGVNDDDDVTTPPVPLVIPLATVFTQFPASVASALAAQPTAVAAAGASEGATARPARLGSDAGLAPFELICAELAATPEHVLCAFSCGHATPVAAMPELVRAAVPGLEHVQATLLAQVLAAVQSSGVTLPMACPVCVGRDLLAKSSRILMSQAPKM